MSKQNIYQNYTTSDNRIPELGRHLVKTFAIEQGNTFLVILLYNRPGQY